MRESGSREIHGAVPSPPNVRASCCASLGRKEGGKVVPSKIVWRSSLANPISLVASRRTGSAGGRHEEKWFLPKKVWHLWWGPDSWTSAGTEGMRKSGSAMKMYRGHCSSLNWKVFRRAGNRAGLAKDREVEEPSERFCLSMRLQGAPTSVLLDPRVVREAGGRQVRDGSGNAQGDLSCRPNAEARLGRRATGLW